MSPFLSSQNDGSSVLRYRAANDNIRANGRRSRASHSIPHGSAAHRHIPFRYPCCIAALGGNLAAIHLHL